MRHFLTLATLLLLPVCSCLASLLVINSEGEIINVYASDSSAVRSFEEPRGNRVVWFTDVWDREYEESFEVIEKNVFIENKEDGSLSNKTVFVTNVIRKLLAPSQIRTPELEVIWRQSSKPLAQREYENQFFALTEQLLTALQDPRAGQTPPVKLSFPEIDAILEQLFVADLATATRASIKLLGIDAALKRYDTLWWDDAIQHELPEN